MATYTGDFVTSEEFEEIKNILSSKFKLERNKVSDTNIIESYNIIVSDGEFLINYFQNKHLIIEGDQQHPQFDQVYLSVDNFLGSNRKPIIKDSSENQEEDRHKQTMSLNKKILIVAIIGIVATTTIGIFALIPIYFNTDSSTEQPVIRNHIMQNESKNQSENPTSITDQPQTEEEQPVTPLTDKLSDNSTLEMEVEFVPSNPSTVINEEHGFRITLADPSLWESQTTSPLLPNDFKVLPGKEETFRIQKIDSFGWPPEAMEIVIFDNNDDTREETIRKLITIFNEDGINVIQTEIESEVEGMWYSDNSCNYLRDFLCKTLGWVQLHQKDGKLYVLHAWSTVDEEEKIPEKLNEHIIFMMNSFEFF